ncbi:MAG: hypothetical protein Q7S40_19555 [Opitutaceae bacterium]|nr:hypothetical protein [Opitutaceae bacterium]
MTALPPLHSNLSRAIRFAGLAFPTAMAALLVSAPAAHAAKAGRREASAAPAPAAAPAGNSAAASASSFENFRSIVDRNIFNPNRVSRSRAAPQVEPPHVDSVALVGTMLSETGAYAFFDSTDPRYRRNLREGELLAGLTVKRVTPQGVELVQQDQTLTLRVNEQLRRTEGGNWRVSPREGTRQEIARATATEPGGMPPIPPDASEVLRRLMEKRQKQLKQ